MPLNSSNTGVGYPLHFILLMPYCKIRIMASIQNTSRHPKPPVQHCFPFIGTYTKISTQQMCFLSLHCSWRVASQATPFSLEGQYFMGRQLESVFVDPTIKETILEVDSRFIAGRYILWRTKPVLEFFTPHKYRHTMNRSTHFGC